MLHRIRSSVAVTRGASAEGDAAAGGRSRWRRVLAPLRVAAWRTGRRPLRLAVVATGVAVATATLFAVSSTTLLLRERALHGSLARVAPQDLSYRADEFGLAFAASPAAARAAADALGLVGPLEPVRAVEFRPLRFRRHLVELTAVEGAGRYMRLSAGRLPRSCAPGRCEVLQIGRARLPQTLAEPGVRLVLVGKATLATPAVLGGFAEPSNATLLVSSDVDGTAALPALESIFRTASWVVPFAPEDVHEWQVRDLLGREARAQALLERVDPAFKLTAPDDALTEGRRQGQLGTRRMLLVGGEIAALLLGFAMLTAIGLRRTLAAEWRRLEERGARRSQLWLFLVAETGTAAVAGVVAGALLGLFAAGLAAGRANVSFGDLLAHGVLTASTLLLLVAACTVATGVLVLAAREHETRHVRGVRVSDVVALAALALALVAATRGGASADSLTRDRGSVVLLLLFPALVSLFAALLAVRLLPPVLRLGERATRRRGPAIRLALLSLARAPARPGAVVAFLVVSVGLALLASGYHATLDRGVRDEAAYQIPLDYTVAEGTQGVALQDAGTSPAALDYSATQGSHPVAPLDAAPLASYHRLAPAVRAYPVLRRFGDVPDLGTGFASPVVLGLPADVIRSLHGWRADFGTRSPGQLADLVGRERPVRLRGAALPAGTTGFALAAKRTGADVELALAIAKPSGEIVTVPLVAPGASRAAFGDRVPARGRLVALELSLTPEAATALAHSQAEGSVKGAPPLGTLALGPLVAYAGARRLGVVTRWRGWIGRAGARRLPGSRVRVRYGLTEGQSALFRPRQPTDGHPLPAVVSPDVARSAAPGGLVTVQNGDQHVTVRVVAVARRFPGTADGDGSFVVTEESHLQTAMDADAPGTGRPLELWLAAPARDTGALGRALERRPFSALEVSSRRELERDLRAAPLSRAIEIALLVGALVALVLAVWGLWLTLLGDIADERGELYDLEAQGASPADLRNQLRLRVAVLATLGLAGGAVLGFVLTREIVRLLQVSASGEAPIPPLVSETGWAVAAAGLVALVVAVGVLVELTVRRAFRESSPATAGGGA